METKEKSFLDRAKLKEVLAFAIPAIFESIFVSLLMTVDTYMVSHLGTAYISAVAITIQPVKLLLVIFTALNTAITKHIAQCVGKNDKSEAAALTGLGLKLTVLITTAIVILGIIFANPIMVISGSNSDSHTAAVLYFRLILLGMIPSNISLYLNAVKRGCQNSKVSLFSNLASNIVNIVFDYILIFGVAGIPSIGIAGAAIASDLGYISAMAVSVISFRNSKDFIFIEDLKGKQTPDPEMKKSFLDMTKTFFSELILTRAGFMVISAITARIGTEAMAVDKVAMNFLDIVFSFGSGLQAAALTMVGRSLGKNDEKSIKDYVKITLFLGVTVSAVLSLFFIMIGKRMILLHFEPNEQIVKYAGMTAFMSTFIVFFQIPQLILNGILRGLGKVKTTLKISVFSILIVQVSGAFLMIMIFNMGLTGKWIASLVSQIVWALLLGINVVKYTRRCFVDGKC